MNPLPKVTDNNVVRARVREEQGMGEEGEGKGKWVTTIIISKRKNLPKGRTALK